MKRFVLGLGLGMLIGSAGFAAVLVIPTGVRVSTAAGTIAEPILLFENNRVKAWSLTLEPGQSTPQHTHQLEEIVICLESSKLRSLKPGPEPEGETVHSKFGEVFMPPVKGLTHVLTNVGDTRYRQISIELK
jgi:predicted metal-dependent enzyme (double-stranded beta helix superfamily)